MSFAIQKIHILKPLMFSTLIALAVQNMSAHAQQTICEFEGDYDNTCIAAFESDREGGVLLIWSPGEEFSCTELQDTAMIATHEYCTMLSGTPMISTTTTRGGGVPYTCDGVTDGSYIANRDRDLADLIDDGEGTRSSSGFSELPSGASVAYWKFLCTRP